MAALPATSTPAGLRLTTCADAPAQRSIGGARVSAPGLQGFRAPGHIALQLRASARLALAPGCLSRRAVLRLSRPLSAVAMAGAEGSPTAPKQRILFVCLGNICRSPAAEAVLKSAVAKRGVSDRFDIDSCGTGGGVSGWWKDGVRSYHEGGESDERMIATAAARGIVLTSRSRPLRREDLHSFDLVLAMDRQNRIDIMEAARSWKKLYGWEPPADLETKVKLMLPGHVSKKFSYEEVPDPYYGGQKGFEVVLDLLEDGCEGLLDRLLAPAK